MQYNPKLKKAAQEILFILNKYDIAGVVSLHTPGHGEFLMHLTPSYSCIKYEQGAIRMRAKKEDFNGNEKKRDEILMNTSNMLRIILDITDPMLNIIEELSDTLDKASNAEHDKGNSSSHVEQNN